jgi:ribosomal protein S18 acetylase RimI-like enzyme
MPDFVQRVDFTEDLLFEVQGFDCGDDVWAREVSVWICGKDPQNSVIADLARGTRVWVYVNATGDIVGFGSLGETSWRWPGPRDEKIAFSIIPMFAVRREYQGVPKGQGETAYAVQIFRDLLAEATAKKPTHPILGLFVHEENTRAIRFYERFGFVRVDNRRKYHRMVLAL